MLSNQKVEFQLSTSENLQNVLALSDQFDLELSLKTPGYPFCPLLGLRESDPFLYALSNEDPFGGRIRKISSNYQEPETLKTDLWSPIDDIDPLNCLYGFYPNESELDLGLDEYGTEIRHSSPVESQIMDVATSNSESTASQDIEMPLLSLCASALNLGGTESPKVNVTNATKRGANQTSHQTARKSLSTTSVRRCGKSPKNSVRDQEKRKLHNNMEKVRRLEVARAYDLLFRVIDNDNSRKPSKVKILERARLVCKDFDEKRPQISTELCRLGEEVSELKNHLMALLSKNK